MEMKTETKNKNTYGNGTGTGTGADTGADTEIDTDPVTVTEMLKESETLRKRNRDEERRKTIKNTETEMKADI